MMSAARSMCGCTWPRDRAFVALADDQVDGACRTWDEGDGGWLVALAGDPQDAVATLDREVLGVGLARFADPETIQAELHGQGLMREVVVVGGGQEHTELRPIEPSSVRGVDVRAADVLGRVRAGPAVDVSGPVEAAPRREPPVDRRRV